MSDSELEQIWNALDGSTAYAAIVRILMLTGARANEIGGLRWSEIVGDKIVLPGPRTKNGREHIIPLIVPPCRPSSTSARALATLFLDGAKAFTAGLGARSRSISASADSGAQLQHWTHHDLRRSMATHMAESGTPPHVIEAILNHVSATRPALPASTIAPAMSRRSASHWKNGPITSRRWSAASARQLS